MSEKQKAREISDTLAAALEGLLKVLTEPPSRSGYIADGYRHGNAVDRARKALEEYQAEKDAEPCGYCTGLGFVPYAGYDIPCPQCQNQNNTPTTPCTPSSQDPN